MEFVREVAPYWVFVSILLCVVAVRPSRENKPNGKHDMMAAQIAFVFMLLLWPVWIIATFWRGWRFRHPRVIRLN